MTNTFQDFFNQQYEALDQDKTKAVDHPLRRPFLRFAKTRTQVALEMLGEEKFKNVLELGCGAGKMLSEKLADFDHYTGMDISSYQLSRIPDSLKKNSRANFREFDLNLPLDLPENTFDLVITLSTIEYLFDPIHFLRNIHRVLKPQGALVIHTMNLAFLPRRLQLLFGQLPTFNQAPGWEGGILHRFTFLTMKKILKVQGFEILDSGCAGIFSSLRRLGANLLASDMLFRCRKAN